MRTNSMSSIKKILMCLCFYVFNSENKAKEKYEFLKLSKW
jgi:hypothetical protein